MTSPQPRASTSAGAVRTRLSRRIAADPTSTALLLAGPAAVELWPGVRRVAEVGGRTLVEADPGALPLTAASVTASPPRRTPTAFVSHFSWAGPGLPTTTAVLTLAYTPSGGGAPATQASLQLDSTGLDGTGLDGAGLDGSRLDEPALRAMAEGFLDNLGRAAEQRSYAA